MSAKIKLRNQEVEVVNCEAEGCGRLMVNLDADQLSPGDLAILKKARIMVSNPETTKPICIHCEYKTVGRRLADWLNEDVKEDDDSDFFSDGDTFIGSSSSGGFGGFSSGGFGGFGGGSFGGGGASGGF